MLGSGTGLETRSTKGRAGSLAYCVKTGASANTRLMGVWSDDWWMPPGLIPLADARRFNAPWLFLVDRQFLATRPSDANTIDLIRPGQIECLLHL